MGRRRRRKKRFEKGLKEGLKESILRIAQVKFRKAKQIKNFLEKVENIKYLKKIEEELIRKKLGKISSNFSKSQIQKSETQKGK